MKKEKNYSQSYSFHFLSFCLFLIASDPILCLKTTFIPKRHLHAFYSEIIEKKIYGISYSFFEI